MEPVEPGRRAQEFQERLPMADAPSFIYLNLHQLGLPWTLIWLARLEGYLQGRYAEASSCTYSYAILEDDRLKSFDLVPILSIVNS